MSFRRGSRSSRGRTEVKRPEVVVEVSEFRAHVVREEFVPREVTQELQRAVDRKTRLETARQEKAARLENMRQQRRKAAQQEKQAKKKRPVYLPQKTATIFVEGDPVISPIPGRSYRRNAEGQLVELIRQTAPTT